MGNAEKGDDRPVVRYVPGQGLPEFSPPALDRIQVEADAVWLVDTVRMVDTGCGEEIFDQGILPLGRLVSAHSSAHGLVDAEMLGRIKLGAAVFIHVGDGAIAGTGRVTGPQDGSAGDLPVEWSLDFHRRIPSAVTWDDDHFPYREDLELFDTGGGHNPFEGVDEPPLMLKVSARDILALIRYGEQF